MMLARTEQGERKGSNINFGHNGLSLGVNGMPEIDIWREDDRTREIFIFERETSNLSATLLQWLSVDARGLEWHVVAKVAESIVSRLTGKTIICSYFLDHMGPKTKQTADGGGSD